MKAVTQSAYGGIEVLSITDLPIPEPKGREVLIKVKAATVNRTDEGILKGTPKISRLFTGIGKQKKSISGTDFAGIIEKVGNEVKDFKIGDRVWGFDDMGLESHAEYLVRKENRPMVKIPEGVSFEDAAASAEGAHYALNMILKSGLTAGSKSVLINGATGAIGTAVLQFAHNLGAHTTAIVNSKNTELAKSLGANEIIDYQTESFDQTEKKFDFIIDAVGKSSFEQCQPLLKEKGVYTSSELGEKNRNLWLSLSTMFSNKKKVVFPFPSDISRTLNHMNGLLAQGEFHPVIEKRYPISEAISAFDYMMSGNKTGNLILNFN